MKTRVITMKKIDWQLIIANTVLGIALIGSVVKDNEDMMTGVILVFLALNTVAIWNRD